TATATGVASTAVPNAPTSTPAPPTNTPPPAIPSTTPVALATRLTPNLEFYVQTYSGEPDLQSAGWSLQVDGLVSNATTLRLSDVKALPSSTLMRTLECIGNPVGGSQIGNTNWKGALFTSLAEKVGVQPSAQWVVMYGDDGYFTSVPIAMMTNPNTLLAYEMGGEPLPRGHGFPVRMLIPGMYGQKQPKWLVRMEFSASEKVGTWEEKGWSHAATVFANGIINTPTENQKLSGQVYVVKGVAFAGESGVSKVEVSTDRGKTFQPAQIQRGPNNFVWTMWAYPWLLPASGKYTLVVRVTDGNGATQTKIGSVLADTFPDGAKDMHAVTVDLKNG
ncbi:MAG: molybdopterin-dependent oxidoreductase, partial [Chloroflexi bacterium]|nr:molybdopterin-dependent oxidoreductase [Chloroflexota bacterium]